eukprot:scaffold1878_cov104-Cylindrotheca_fusiformis.AAC.6
MTDDNNHNDEPYEAKNAHDDQRNQLVKQPIFTKGSSSPSALEEKPATWADLKAAKDGRPDVIPTIIFREKIATWSDLKYAKDGRPDVIPTIIFREKIATWSDLKYAKNGQPDDVIPTIIFRPPFARMSDLE